MKKILSCLIVALLLIMALASCQISGGKGTTTEPAATSLEKAADLVRAMYKDKPAITTADMDLTKFVAIDTVPHPVEWSVEVTAGNPEDAVIEEKDEYFVVLNINEKASVEAKYVLTAVVSDPEGNTATVVFDERTVPAFSVMSWADYVAAEKDAPVAVRGVVTAIFCKSQGASYNGMYLQDNDGGYYIYSMANDVDPAEAGIKVGMTVQVSGIKDIYSGTHEVKDAAAEIIDAEIKELVVFDYTEIFQNAASLADEALAGKQSQLVTVKGVTIVPQDDTVSSGYFKFKVGNKETYVRISSSVCPIPKAEQDAFKAAHKEHAGWTADVTGVISVFNGNFYLTPINANAFDYKSAPECTHEAAAEWTKDGKNHWHVCALCGLSMGDSAAHTIANGACSVCAYAPLTATLPEAADIGMEQGHNTYTTDTYILTGTITEIYNETYGNLYIADEAGNILTIYGTYSADGSTRFDKMESKPAVGDVVVLLGVLGQYNGTAQAKNAWILSWETPAGACQHTNVAADYTKDGLRHWKVCADCGEVATDKVAHTIVNGVCSVCAYAPTAVTLPEALEIGAAKDDNVFDTSATYIVTAVVKEIYNETYGNMRLTDEAGNILTIYGTYSADGSTRFDAMETKPAVGDTVTIYGALGRYGSTVQIKNGWIVAIETSPVVCEHQASSEWFKDDNNHWHNCALCGAEMDKAAHDFSNGDCVCGKEAPAVEEVINTVAGALAGAEGDAVVITGTVTGIYQAYNSQYGNISVYVTDETGTILAFRLVGEWSLNQVITVTGTVTVYNGVNQIAAGCTAVLVGTHECNYSNVVVTDPTCEDAGYTTHTCPICKDSYIDSEVDALGHTTDNGTCERCGNVIGENAPTVESVTLGMIGKQSGWDSSYTQRTVTYDIATVVFSSANKQSATITDRPVVAGPKSASTQYVTISITNGKTIDGVTFNLKRWSTSKTFVKISIEYLNADGAWVEASVLALASNGALVNADEVLSAANLPAGVTQVRLAIQTTNRMQLGIGDIVVDVK